MSRYIVMDIVFYGSSLNYDQGTGNYQELKKITKWDGKQYSLVSRYALRYSILETGKQMGLWKLADGCCLQRAGKDDKTVIQPSIDSLLSGKILTYPEFDLFGYLITETTPQNWRETPVKISHAISLTPFEYDTHLSGNLGLAKRMIEKVGKMDPNLFNVEEHQTYYIYTVVVDVDRIGKNEVYLAKKGDKWSVELKEDENEYEITIEKGEKIKIKKEEIIEDKEIKTIFILKNKVEKIEEEGDVKLYKILQTLEIEEASENKTDNKKDKIEKRIKDLIKAILNLKRNIKGRNEMLQPKLLILGSYNNQPYRSYKDSIVLTDEYEEIYEEKKEPIGENEVRVIRRIVKQRKPTFLIKGIFNNENREAREKNVLIKNLNTEHVINAAMAFNNEVTIFKGPEIEVRIES